MLTWLLKAILVNIRLAESTNVNVLHIIIEQIAYLQLKTDRTNRFIHSSLGYLYIREMIHYRYSIFYWKRAFHKHSYRESLNCKK